MTSPYKTTSQELKIKQSWTLEQKIEPSIKRIKEFYEYQDGNVYVSFSGGKDSTVLLHLVRSLYPNVVAVFTDTTNEFIEIYKFVKQTENVVWLKPKMTFKEVLKKHGFPLVSKDVSTAITRLRNPNEKNWNVRRLYLTGLNRKNQFSQRWKLAKMWRFLFDKFETKFDITSKCCNILKKDPALRYEKQSGLKSIVGTMADESDMRKRNYVQFGCNIYSEGKEKARPLSIWLEKDIWAYMNKYKVNYSDIYKDKVLDDGTILKGESRTGCAGCAYGCQLEDKTKDNRFDRLKKRRPKFFKNLMKIENNGVTYEKALKIVMSAKRSKSCKP